MMSWDTNINLRTGLPTVPVDRTTAPNPLIVDYGGRDELVETLLDTEHDSIITLPDVPPILAPVVMVVPLQLLAYHIAVRRGCDVDQPRNLAKSVTVE